ncbi:MAG: hypothetical protein WBE13_14840 [Candidatus Acidiferrum sp.]
MNRRRYFIPIFALAGVIRVFVQHLVSHLLVPYEKVGGVLRPSVPVTLPRMYAANLVVPALYLGAIALGLWFALGTPVPQWTRKRWPLAIVAYYLLHIPLAFFIPFPHWGFLTYLGLSYLGFASALWILSGRLHPVFPLIVLVPVAFQYSYRHLPLLVRVGLSPAVTVLLLALAGCWLGDAANRFDLPASASSAPGISTAA